MRNRFSHIADKATRFFFKQRIAHKMFLAYLPLGLLLVLISALSLSSLDKMSTIHRRVLEHDIPTLAAFDGMIDAILSQELYGKRYMILHDPEILKAFWEMNQDFATHLTLLRDLDPTSSRQMQAINDAHEEYNALFVKLFQMVGHRAARLEGTERGIRDTQEKIVSLLKARAQASRQEQHRKAQISAEISTYTFRAMAVLCSGGFLLAMAAALFITRNISISVSKLKLATALVSEGRFDSLPAVNSQDELGDLSRAFGDMAVRLKSLEEMYIDSSPLTHLPGGVAIENVLKKRLDASATFAFCMLDLDNFKALNDHYGYARGNDLIQHTARLIEQALARHGNAGDFIGHIGGDDFVLITSYERYEPICREIIRRFDETAPDFYDAADREKGYIEGMTRQGTPMNFPFVTLSIAVVTNRHQKFDSHLQVSEVAADLKKYAKTMDGSNYVLDRRNRLNGQDA